MKLISLIKNFILMTKVKLFCNLSNYSRVGGLDWSIKSLSLEFNELDKLSNFKSYKYRIPTKDDWKLLFESCHHLVDEKSGDQVLADKKTGKMLNLPANKNVSRYDVFFIRN